MDLYLRGGGLPISQNFCEFEKQCLFGSKTVFFGQEVHYYMVYIAYFIFHILYCIFHIFLDKGFPKGGVGPTFGKNFQIISFFCLRAYLIVSLSTLFSNLSSQSLAAGRPSRCCPPPAPQVSPGVVDYACTQASLYMSTMLIILPHTLSFKSKRIGDTDYMPPRISTILILLLITSPTWSFSTTCWSSFLAAFTSLSSSS